ncbi:MAG TPA: response regulator [Actinomycetota bacterium]|nr:response regulator [Actinomycetota bacterium]
MNQDLAALNSSNDHGVGLRVVATKDGNGVDEVTPKKPSLKLVRPDDPGPSSTEVVHGQILIIEDNPLISLTLHDALSSIGLKVVSVPTGSAGLAAARSGAIGAIVLDLLLPDMDGMEVLRKLKRDPLTEDVPVVMLTAVGTTGDRKTAMAQGCVAFLLKPPNLAELVNLLDEVSVRTESR